MNSKFSFSLFFVFLGTILCLWPKHALAEDNPKSPIDYVKVMVGGGPFATGDVLVKNTHQSRAIRYNITVFEGFQAIGAVKGMLGPGESKKIAEADRSVPGGRITKSFRIYAASYASPQ
jgi:hypothetical protein